MAYINTLTIPPQESTDALAEAMAQALGNALGWTVDGTSVWQDESKDGLRFCFAVQSNYIYVGIGNGVTTQSSERVIHSNNVSFCVDYVKTSNTVVIGARTAGSAIALWALIAKNAAGVYKAIHTYSNVQYWLAKDWATIKSFGAMSNSLPEMSTSIVRCPDVFGGCMFEDLYLILSCPCTLTDNVFFIGGKYYRRIGTYNSAGFAIPVG